MGPNRKSHASPSLYDEETTPPSTKTKIMMSPLPEMGSEL